MILTTPYIDLRTAPMPQYVPLYKSLLSWAPHLGLDLDAVYLYSHLCALAVCSSDKGFVDEHGHVYVIYTRERAAKLLGCSVRKVTNVFRSLVSAGLITVVRQTNRAGCNVAPHIRLRQWAEPSIMLSLQDIKTGKLPYLTTSTVRVLVDTYCRIPRSLQHESYTHLSVRAKLLYSIALDTMQLSLKTNHCDDNGFWCSLSAEQLQQWLQCGHSTLSTTYRDLEDCGLMIRERVECGCPMHIYLRACWEQLPAPQEQTSLANSSPQFTEKNICNNPESARQSPEICAVSNFTQLPLVSHSHSPNLPRAVARDGVCENIAYMTVRAVAPYMPNILVQNARPPGG